MNTRLTARALVGAAALITAGLGQAYAYEPGSPGWATKPGITIGPGAGAPPPGLYMFDQVFTYQSNLTGPGGNALGNPAVNAAVEASGLLFVPGWTFLGGTYDAVLVQPFIMDYVGAINQSGPALFGQSGIHNTFIVPGELSWKLGTSGFSVLVGLGIYAPNGSISGPAGLNNVGNPWWTFQPNLKLSYLKDGWNLTANLYEEINTKNSIDNYTSGDIFHADFTFTKTIGKWTVGPVAYYVAQVTNDTNGGTMYGGGTGTNRYDIWAVGGLIGYEFGPVGLTVWALDEVSAHASNGGTAAAGAESITKGWTAFASISYRLWAPEAPVSTKNPLITK
ncbi:MAG: transporter [Xanthobacteraceae bacterium]